MQGDANQQQGDLKVDKNMGTAPLTEAPAPVKVSSFLAKRAMTEADLAAYYGSGYDVLGAEPSGSNVDPKTLAAMGLGGGTIVGANRMRTKNIARRELSGIRKAYMDMIASGKTDPKLLRSLNKELGIRGASKTLKAVPTTGLADALMLKSEKGLAQKLLKQRYKGVLPAVALSLLGAAAYNKLND